VVLGSVPVLSFKAIVNAPELALAARVAFAYPNRGGRVPALVIVRPSPVTLVTEPPPDGVAHAPSPLQNVDEDALVPELRLVTGKFPVIPVESGSPVQLVRVPEVGVPNTGVTKVGDVANTAAPLPVSSVIAALRLAELGVARNVETPAANPDTPVEIGNPVQLVKVPLVGVPRTGVTNVGEVAKTFAPVPVSSVIAAAKLAEDGVAKNVATLVPKPDIPVETGRPVALVSVADDGVPKAGVTRVGELALTTLP